MASDEMQIQTFADWPVSHAKRMAKDNRQNPVTVYDQKDMIETIPIQFQKFQSDWRVTRGYHDQQYQMQPKDQEVLR